MLMGYNFDSKILKRAEERMTPQDKK